MDSFIVRNPSAITTVSINDLGLLVSPSSQQDLAILSSLNEILNSSDLVSLINATTLIRVINGDDVSADTAFIDAVTSFNEVQVSKSPKSGEFSSIKDAIDGITLATSTNQFIVRVGPGEFIEDTITMKPYVYVKGSGEDITTIRAATTNQHVIVGADNSEISECFLTGATSTGYAAVFHSSLTGTTNKAFTVDSCRLGNNDTLVISESPGAPTAVFLNGCTFGSINQFNQGFIARNTGSGAGRIKLQSCSTIGMSTPFPSVVARAENPSCEIIMNSVQIRSSGLTSGDCIAARNGGVLRLLSTNIRGFNAGIHIENIGSAPTLVATSILNQDNTYDLLVEHPDATGTYSGNAEREKVSVDPDADITTFFHDGGITLISPVYVGDTIDSSVNVAPIINYSPSIGLLYGGELISSTGLGIVVSAGAGFISDVTYDPPPTKVVEWTSTSLLASDNEDSLFLYVNHNGTVSISTSPPNSIVDIALGRIATANGMIHLIEGSYVGAIRVGNKIDSYLRRVFGPIFSQGSIVSANGSRNLSITSGLYFYGQREYVPSGGTNVEFITHYRSSTGDFIEDTNTVVDNTSFDDDSGVLHLLSTGAYTKHTLYLVGEGEQEAYLFVYGQQQYGTLSAAVAGDLPTPPTHITAGVVLLASLIVQEGNSAIVEILDERPRASFAASSVASSVSHGSLAGLLNDDHPQYLLRNGSNAMTNDLDMGSQSIVSVNLVDGVDVSSHSSRHDPGGSDAQTTGIAVTLSGNTVNAEGIVNSFSRSDHVHTILTSTGSTTSVGTASLPGTSAALARSDHTHAHGLQTSPVQHALATGSAHGFMSSTDKTKLDGIGGARVIKSGTIDGTSFSGNPKTATITFGTPFSSTAYAISIMGDVSRNWTYESKLAGSFVINAHANTAFTTEVSWIAISTGETTE